MIGKRLEDNFYPQNPGEYVKDNSGNWLLRLPNNCLGRLSGPNVQEHGDGTITIDGDLNIEESENYPAWSGCLEKGVWKEC